MKKTIIIILMTMILAGCGGGGESTKTGKSGINFDEYPETKSYTKDEVLHSYFDPIESCEDGDIAYLSLSTIGNGYIGIALKEVMESKVKIRISKNDTTYTYDLDNTDMVAFPLQMGNGTYMIKILENIEGNQYAVLYKTEIEVNLSDENLPYLYPNQIVDYDKSDIVIDKSFEVVKDDKNDLKRIYDLYLYVMEVLNYDNDKAKNVVDIYTLPNLEEAMEKGAGICFDYASLLAALCRCQHIPARVIVGYTDIEYHAWVEAYVESEGWINPKYYFDSENWSLIDPTFDDSGNDYEGAYDEVYRY